MLGIATRKYRCIYILIIIKNVLAEGDVTCSQQAKKGIFFDKANCVYHHKYSGVYITTL